MAEATNHVASAAQQLRTVGVRTIARRIAKHTSVGFARAAMDPPSSQQQQQRQRQASQQQQQPGQPPPPQELRARQRPSSQHVSQVCAARALHILSSMGTWLHTLRRCIIHKVPGLVEATFGHHPMPAPEHDAGYRIVAHALVSRHYVVPWRPQSCDSICLCSRAPQAPISSVTLGKHPGPVSPFATAPASILAPDPPAAAPSNPTSPFALAQVGPPLPAWRHLLQRVCSCRPGHCAAVTVAVSSVCCCGLPQALQKWLEDGETCNARILKVES